MASAPDVDRAGRLAARVLVVLASVLAFLAIFASWAKQQALDTDNWTDTSSDLLADEAIRGQLATFMVDAIYTHVDVQGELQKLLPRDVRGLAGPAAGGLKQVANRGARELLKRHRTQQLWRDANRAAHHELIAVLKGRSEAVVATDGVVTLDLRQLIAQTADQIGIGARIEDRIPTDAASITILESKDLELAQDVVDVLDALATVLAVLAIVLFAIAIWVAGGWRRQTVRAAGAGLVIAGIAALIARALAGDIVVDALAANETVRPAVDHAWSIATSMLGQVAGVVIAYGLLVILGAWLVGPSHPALVTRRELAPYLSERSVAYGAVALIVLLVLVWNPADDMRRPLPVLIFAGLLAFGVEMLRRRAAREHPGASLEQAAETWRDIRAGVARLAAWRPGAAAARRPDVRIAALKELAELKERGILEHEEFQLEKARILNGDPAARV